MADALPADSPVAQALATARTTIDKIKTVMVKVYNAVAGDQVQSGLKQIPDVIRNVINKGVEVITNAVKTIIDGVKMVKEKAGAVIGLLKQIPDIIDAAGDLMDEATHKSAMLGARIAAFIVVFVEERFDDVANMLELFSKLLAAIGGTVDKAYNAAVKLGVTV